MAQLLLTIITSLTTTQIIRTIFVKALRRSLDNLN